MKKIDSVNTMKLNFLELWKKIQDSETQALIKYESSITIQNKIENFCTKEFPLNRVLLVFHSYASVAYLSAELIANAKIFLDNEKQKYILLARRFENNNLAFSIVYSNIKELSKYPTLGISIDDMINFLENDNPIDELKNYYLSVKNNT